MKALRGVNLQIHIFLTSVLVLGELSVSFPGGKSPRSTFDRRLDPSQNQSGRRGKWKIVAPTGTKTQTTLSSSPLPVAIPIALSRLIITEHCA
jgi:hypothetical protein